MEPSENITPNLWDIARKRLANTEEAQLAKAAVDNNTLSQQLLELVQGKQQQCMDRRWKFRRSNGEVVVVRDVFEKVVRWLQRFKEVGDVATQYDPTHAALPWAGVRMLLQIAINDAESLGTIAEGIETVSSLITRCAVLETIHLPPHRYPLSKAHATLQDALVALYTAILSWLSVAGAYYEKHLIKRLLRSIVSSGPTLTSIFQEERKVSQLATSLHDQLASSTAVTVKSLDISFNSLMSMFRDLEQPIARVAGTLDRIERSLEAKERQQLIEWLSGIDGNPPSSLVIMGTILRQLAFLVPGGGVHHSAWDEYSQRVKDSEGLEPTPLSLDDCRDLIILITADYPTTIIIDGLDEAEGDIRELLNILQHIIDESQNTVKLFLSSRDSIPVDIHLQNVRSIRVTHVDNAKDVSTFVKSKVGTAVQYKRLLRGKISAEVETRIVRTLTHGSREMFLWASLNLEQLCGAEFEVEADVMDELESLRAPKSLLETLEQMYRRVQQYKPKARQITNIVFGWLLVSERQLSNPELLDIIRLTVNKRLGGVDEENIKSLCRGFVNSENASGSFAFAHESIREFLQGRDDFNATRLQFAAFSSCLRCLTARYDDGERGPLRPDDVVDEMQIDSPNPTPTMDRTEDGSPDVAPACFWQYAIYYWLDHYTKILGQDYRAKADPDLLQFIFEYKGHRFIAWLREMLIVLDEQLKRDDVLSNKTLLLHLSYLESLKAKQQPAIFVASVYGISIILERLEREHTNVDWNEKNIYGTSGLYLSAIRGQDDIVKYLLSHGVDPNMVGGRFKTPIQGAAIRGHASTVEILLNSGADPLLEGRYPTALHAAISGGHEPVIQLLVGNSSCHQAAKLGSLVQAGFYFGRYDAVMSLLRQYFDNEVNSKKFQDEWISIALQAALYGTKNADTNNARIMKLLEEISDINEPGGLFGNALQAASFGGSAAWVHMVLERGADPDSIGYCGSALRAASFGGHNEVVRLLLERGATLGPGNKDALEACALKNRLTNTSEYDECKRHFGAAMRTARRENRYRMVDFMLENGAGFLRRDTLEDVAVGGGGRWGDGGYSPNPVLDIFINVTDNVPDRLQGGGGK
ncbi:Ankyrin-3 [Colletotrichum fructicola]|nr:Ankyrin-3 [Colletotrichum fructicola]KAF4938624.1 Ankyrin-3 [Colletotrichum fructicola]